MPLLCLGDIHLSHLIWESLLDVRDDAFVGFRSFVDLGIANKWDLMLVGDVFDVPKPEPDIISAFRVEMDRCKAAGIKVYYIQGNHDKRATPWGSSVHDHPIYVGDGQPFKVDGHTCIGLDYCGREKIQSEIVTANSKKPDILFLHQAVRQAIGFESAWNCDLDWITAPLTILGDIHKPLDMKYGAGTAYYTGASSARSISEFDNKSCLLLQADLSVTRIAIEHRSFFVTSTAEANYLESIRHWIEGKATSSRLQPVLFLRYPQGTLVWKEPVNEILKGLARLVPRPYSTAIPERVTTDTDVSLQDMLQKFAKPGTPVYSLVLDLLDAKEDPLEVIRAHKEVFRKC